MHFIYFIHWAKAIHCLGSMWGVDQKHKDIRTVRTSSQYSPLTHIFLILSSHIAHVYKWRWSLWWCTCMMGCTVCRMMHMYTNEDDLYDDVHVWWDVQYAGWCTCIQMKMIFMMMHMYDGMYSMQDDAHVYKWRWSLWWCTCMMGCTVCRMMHMHTNEDDLYDDAHVWWDVQYAGWCTCIQMIMIFMMMHMYGAHDVHYKCVALSGVLRSFSVQSAIQFQDTGEVLSLCAYVDSLKLKQKMCERSFRKLNVVPHRLNSQHVV